MWSRDDDVGEFQTKRVCPRESTGKISCRDGEGFGNIPARFSNMWPCVFSNEYFSAQKRPQRRATGQNITCLIARDSVGDRRCGYLRGNNAVRSIYLGKAFLVQGVHHYNLVVQNWRATRTTAKFNVEKQIVVRSFFLLIFSPQNNIEP